jgi:hypothetical protein
MASGRQAMLSIDMYEPFRTKWLKLDGRQDPEGEGVPVLAG